MDIVKNQNGRHEHTRVLQHEDGCFENEPGRQQYQNRCQQTPDLDSTDGEWQESGI